MKKYKSEISGHLDIFAANHEEYDEGEVFNWQEVMIHGDPEGLRSFAKLLIRIAELNQDDLADIPVGAREHIHLRPKWDISESSFEVTVGRIDAKGTGRFYDRYISRDKRYK